MNAGIHQATIYPNRTPLRIQIESVPEVWLCGSNTRGSPNQYVRREPETMQRDIGSGAYSGWPASYANSVGKMYRSSSEAVPDTGTADCTRSEEHAEFVMVPAADLFINVRETGPTFKSQPVPCRNLCVGWALSISASRPFLWKLGNRGGAGSKFWGEGQQS